MRTKAVKTEIDGYVFDSKTEAARYVVLKALERSGEISGLTVHPAFELALNGQRLGKFTADFRYFDKLASVEGGHGTWGTDTVEDVKGWKRSKKTGKMLPRVNREFGIKVKLMKALYGIDVRVV